MKSVASDSPGVAPSDDSEAVNGAMTSAATATTMTTTTDGVLGSSEPMLVPSTTAASQQQKNTKRGQGTTEPPANEDKEPEPAPPPPKPKRAKKKSVGRVVNPVKKRDDVQEILDRLVGQNSTDETQIEAMETLIWYLFDAGPDMSTSEALSLVLILLRQKLDKCEESSSSDGDNTLAPPVVIHAIGFLYMWLHHFDTPRNDDMSTFGGASTVVRAMIDYPHDRRLQASCAQALYLFSEGSLGTIPAWEEVRQRRYRELVEAGAVLPAYRFLVTTFSDPNEDSEFKWQVRTLFDHMCDDATIDDVDALNAVGAVFFLANVWNWYQQNHRQRLIATAGCRKWIHKLTSPRR